REQWGDAWDKIAKAEHAYATFYARYNLLERRGNLCSDLFGYAKELVRLADEKAKPNAERLREFRESEMKSLLLGLYSTAPIYDALEIERLTSGLTALANTLGADDPTVIKALAGRPPQERATQLIT